MFITETAAFKERIKEKLSAKYPDFDREWVDMVNSTGQSVIQPLRQILKKKLDVIGSIFSVSLTVIVDNNFIFGNIKKLVNRNEPLEGSFIYKLCRNEFIRFYAPPALQDELYAKIATESVDNKEQAREYADTLLQFITIKEAQWVEEWKRANNLIGHTDADDVPYLALALDIGGHSIISYDKVFLQQNDVQIWDQKDLGKIVTSYNSGAIALLLLGTSAIILYQMVRFVLFILKLVAETLVQILSGLFAMLAVLPWQVWAAAGGLFALAYHFSDEVKDFLEDTKKTGKEWLEERKTQWAQSIRSIRNLLETLKENEDVKTGFDFAGFLLTEFHYLHQELQRIEVSKAR